MYLFASGPRTYAPGPFPSGTLALTRGLYVWVAGAVILSAAAGCAGLVMQIDWNSVFFPSLGIAEIVIRGTLMYLGLFVILRFMARRQAGQFGPADLLVIVLIADAAQNGLGKEYQSVTEGIVLVMTIVTWEYLIDWLTYRFPAIRPVLRPPSLTLVREGRVIDEAMRKEMLSIDELASQLRQHQVEDIAEVKLAKLEGDGRISVLRREAPAGR
jgi:uncharacterized membrane protein YcaP (DUF421 family)